MKNLKEMYQDADWKSEKHVPVISAPMKVKKGAEVMVTITVGAEIPHPNTTEHHIKYLNAFFMAEDDKYPHDLGRFELNAHGASVRGPNTSAILTQPNVSFTFKTEKGGTLMACSFCNIHGLWESSVELAVE